MAGKDFYQILGVEKSATEAEIKKAYRKLAKQYHPDVNPGNKQAEDKFKEITEAYAVLTDPQKRKQYDAVGPGGFQSGFDFSDMFGGGFRPGAGGHKTWHFSTGRGGDFNFDVGGLEDIFESFLGKGQKRGFGGFQREPEAQTYQMEVDFLTAVRGGEVEVEIGGERKKIQIPEGIRSGQKIRLAGKGRGTSDTFIAINVRPHPLFERDGDDILVKVTVDVSKAILGALVEVPTIDGTSKVALPAGTSSGQKLRLKGKGVHLRGGGRGDQYVEVAIVVPKNIDEKSRELLEEFARRNTTAG